MRDAVGAEEFKTDKACEPPCPQRLLTGLIGAGVVAVGSVILTLVRVLAHPTIPTRVEYVALVALTCLVMAFIEVVVFRVYRVQFDFSRKRCSLRQARADVLRRWGALCITLLLSWVCYWVLGEYGLRFTGVLKPEFTKSWYAPFFHLFMVVTVLLPVLALPYFHLCTMFGRWPRAEDEYLRLWQGYGACLRLQRPDPGFLAAVRSLGVKLFFLPLMSVFVMNNGQAMEQQFLRLFAGPWLWDVNLAGRVFHVIYEGLFFIDVNIALLGYVCCFRFLDTHIRSAEPTLFGWLVALACYPPFNAVITGSYLPYESHSRMWEGMLSGLPWLYYAVGAAILLLVGVYLLATLAFAFRFSNLTHRGIICRGPYRLVRHPAYAAKNLSWWLLSLPFLSSPAACARLLLLNLIYVLRALTEERHLSRDPVYRDYMKRVKWRFIPGCF